MQGLRRVEEWLLSRPGVAIALIFTGALSIRLVALALTQRTLPAGDELELFVRAARAVIGPPLEDDAGRAPGLLFFYSTVFRIFSVHAVVAKLANGLVSALTVVPVALIGRRLGGPRVGGLAAIGVALYPTYIAFSHYLWPAPLYILILMTGMALLLGSLNAKGARALVGLFAAGVVLGASALVKESGILFPPLAVLYVAFQLRSERRRAIVRSLCLAAGVAAAILPWMIHIQRPDLPFALITRTGYMNLFIGNHPSGHGIAMTEYPTLGTTRLEAESVARERALAEIERRLPAWPIEKLVSELPRFFTPTSFAVRRLLMPPGDPGAWGYRMTWPVLDRSGPRRALVVVVVVSYLLAIGFGAAGLVLARRHEVTVLFALFMASQILPSIATFAMSRFRLASMACFILCAASAIVHGRRDWAVASGPRRAWAIASVLGLFALVALDYEAVLESTGR